MVEKLQLQTKEGRTHSSTLVPYSIYDCKIPEYFPNVPMHWHTEMEIDIFEEGEGEFFCGDEHFAVKAGDVVFIPPNVLHATYQAENAPLSYMAFVFHANMLGLGSNDRSSMQYIRPLTTGRLRPCIHFSEAHRDHDMIHRLALEIQRLAIKNNAYDDLFLKGVLFQLVWYMEKEGNVEEKPEDNGISELIRPAIEYMTYHFQEEITIAKLAGACSISPSHFMNSFQKAAGLSAMEYLMHIRIRAVCSELTETKDDIAQIAFRCGFNNLSNFNRHFKTNMGMSPRDYRTKNVKA